MFSDLNLSSFVLFNCSNRQDLQQLSSKTCHSIEMDKTKHDPEFVPPGDDDWPSQVFRDQIISCL